MLTVSVLTCMKIIIFNCVEIVHGVLAKSVVITVTWSRAILSSFSGWGKNRGWRIGIKRSVFREVWV